MVGRIKEKRASETVVCVIRQEGKGAPQDCRPCHNPACSLATLQKLCSATEQMLHIFCGVPLCVPPREKGRGEKKNSSDIRVLEHRCGCGNKWSHVICACLCLQAKDTHTHTREWCAHSDFFVVFFTMRFSLETCQPVGF